MPLPRAVAAFVVLVTLAGCAPSGASRPADIGIGPTESQGPKRLIIAMAGEPPGISLHINPAGTKTPGIDELIELTSPGLSSIDSVGERVPLLAASLPSTEGGSWSVFPDGRMQTTWTLRPGITWHDGVPFT